jgi:hypothetical protein
LLPTFSKIGLTRAAATRPVHLISDAQQVLAECLLSTLQKYLKVGAPLWCGCPAKWGALQAVERCAQHGALGRVGLLGGQGRRLAVGRGRLSLLRVRHAPTQLRQLCVAPTLRPLSRG